jgi:hypothetical protein
MNTTEIFLIAMLIIFTLPWLMWRLGRTDYYAPLVVVQIITGILLGPGVLGALCPTTTPSSSTRRWSVAERRRLVGGDAVRDDRRHRARPAQAWVHRRESGITAGLALGTPLLLRLQRRRLMLLPRWLDRAAARPGSSCSASAWPAR